ncbi:MAG: hypothetical protein KC994_27305, partial [Candidatus Omnitrophica bacterium]|nr:hypothetical protein [Candidatus Omnitrophota bacterium]
MPNRVRCVDANAPGPKFDPWYRAARQGYSFGWERRGRPLRGRARPALMVTLLITSCGSEARGPAREAPTSTVHSPPGNWSPTPEEEFLSRG